MSCGRGLIGKQRAEEREGKYLESSHVLDQQPTGKSVRYSQGREDIVDEMEERFSPGVATIPRHRVEDCIRLAGRGKEPEISRIRCQILSGQSAYINLYCFQFPLYSRGWGSMWTCFTVVSGKL